MTRREETRLAVWFATLSAGVLAAQATGVAAPPYTIATSSTLTGVIRDCIDGAGLTSSLVCDGTGSGLAESALLGSPPTQRLAPMTRNFKASTLNAHATWNASLSSIMGLDAAVIVEAAVGAGYSGCPNLSAALDPNAPGKAVVDSAIGLILGGKGGVGDTAACLHPDRLAAIDALAGCFNGVPYISHFYREDDRSGPAEVIRQRFRVQRFCNGRAPGRLAGVDSNLANDDADPMRRPCVPEAAGLYAAAKCTVWPSGSDCTSTPAASGCTQGFLVALSQNDPGTADVTASISQRVASAPDFSVLGFASRRAGRQPGLTAARVNTISPNNFNVRASEYLGAYRLFANWSDRVVGQGRTGGLTPDDLAAEQAQEALYNWITDPVSGGRFNVDPILLERGFVPCTDDYSDPVGPANLCSAQIPPPAAEDLPLPCLPAGVPGDGRSICCSNGTINVKGQVCPAYCGPAGSVCFGEGTCCAGLSCVDDGTGTSVCM